MSGCYIHIKKKLIQNAYTLMLEKNIFNKKIPRFRNYNIKKLNFQLLFK